MIPLLDGGLTFQFQEPRHSHALLYKLLMRGDAVDILVEIGGHLLLVARRAHELEKVRRVHLVESLRPARQAAERGIDHGIYHVVRDGGLRRLLADVVGWDDLFGRDDRPFGGHGRLQGRYTRAKAPGVAVDVALMDMD